MRYRWFILPAFMLIAAAALGQSPADLSESDDDGRELGEKLIRRVRADSDEGLMAGIMRLMDTAAVRLEVDFDAGEETQVLQQRIMDQLNEAITEAASQRQLVPQGGQSSKGDKRRKPRSAKRQQEKGKGTTDDPKTKSSSDRANEDAASGSGSTSGGSLRERRRSWGNLPSREREEVIQGASEQYLERFRAWIERYYQALQESDDSRSR
jgi:hypothetical protein